MEADPRPADRRPRTPRLRFALLALLRGAAFALRDEECRALLLLPGLVSLAAQVAFFGLAARVFDLLEGPLLSPLLATAEPSGLARAVWFSLAGLYFSTAAVSCLAAASILSGALLERIGARADREVVGSLPRAPSRSFGDRLGSLAAGFAGASRSGAAAFALAPASLLPLGGPALAVGAASWTVGRGALERSMERRGLGGDDRARLLRENRPTVLLFGLAALAASALPVVGGFLGLPAAHAGAPFLLARLGPRSNAAGEAARASL